MKKIVAFPQMGNYYVPAEYLFSRILNCKIMSPKKITRNTIEMGTKNSPDFVCMPFKYTLGTMIECLDSGADIVMQFGGGCRYGYYSELQEQILKDLGYSFQYINLISAGKADVKKIYMEMKKVNPKLKIVQSLYYLLVARTMIKYMDNVDDYIRHNMGFEEKAGELAGLNKRMLKEFSGAKGLIHLTNIYIKYYKQIKKVKIVKNKNCLKVGIIGELYSVMEPFANYYLEKELASYNIDITRFTNVEYLLFQKKKQIKKYLKKAKNYIKYKMGADASDNIARTLLMCEEKYDGIIHIKSSFCTPEIGAMPIINKICNEYDIPVIFFSFDSNTSEVGIKTRLEAFHDMIEMRRNR
ncbi:MAG: hypothetical protein E7173_03340 [Firmicutes bacterium]|nr:hypothetical protein [Bacillota bacterium]